MSAKSIFRREAVGREFWSKGCYVDPAGKNTKTIKESIADRLKRDQERNQIAMFDPRDAFMGRM